MEACQEKKDQDSLQQEYNTLCNKINNDFANQTKSVSDNSRRIIWAILASVWAILIARTGSDIVNCCIKMSAIVCFIYLFIDLLHYYIDSEVLYDKNNRLYEREINHNFLEGIKLLLHEHTKISFKFLRLKVLVCAIAVITFIIGIVQLFF